MTVKDKKSGFQFASRRLDVLFRSLTAVVGGYGFMILAGSWLARFLPMAPEQATVTAMMLSFSIFTGVFIWAFSASDIRKVWVYMAIWTVVFLGSLMWSINVGGRL